MLQMLLELGVFTLKAIIISALIVFVFGGIILIARHNKDKSKGDLVIKNLTNQYLNIKEMLLNQILPKKLFKQFQKERKKTEKEKAENTEKNTFVIHFHGDVKASAVTALREEITSILAVATTNDEVVVCVESGGGLVNAYGLAAAQLQRIRARNICLTVAIDKIAASGGYLMACVANKILAAPYAIVGSIGVIVQLPNFHRVLKDKHIDFEQHMAGNYKRTITLFGENTEAERAKLQEELEDIHGLFKSLILQYRPQIDIDKVATGEHWLASQALPLKLVDELSTSDDYLMAKSQEGKLFEISFHPPQSLSKKLFAKAQTWYSNIVSAVMPAHF